jgi:hypothetical protein
MSIMMQYSVADVAIIIDEQNKNNTAGAGIK